MVNSSSGIGPEQGDRLGEAVAGSARRQSRRSRILVPASIAAVAAAGLIAVPVFAAGSDLPSISAQQLLAKALSSRVQTFSGTVQTSVDLGIPSALLNEIPSAVAGSGAGTSKSQGAQAEQELTSLVDGSHVLTVAADGPTRQLVASSDSGSVFTLVHNGSSAWVYDGQSNQATHLTGLDTADAVASQTRTPTDPQQVAAKVLAALGPSTTVSVSGDSKVAGQSVYELSVEPKGSGSTIGEVRIAVDAANGMPLQVVVLPSDGSDAILNVGFSQVSFATPSASTFAFTPPSGAKVTQEAAPTSSSSGTFTRTSGGAPGQAVGTDPKGTVPKGTGPKDLGSKGMAARPDTTVIGTGWDTIYVIKPSAAQGQGGISSELGSVKSFGKSVPGGTLISTKLVNVLVTDNGTVYAGAVTPALLEQAAAGK
jgi:outer membrane lipoprotein-sorting protein